MNVLGSIQEGKRANILRAWLKKEKLTSEVGLLRLREPEDEVLFPEVSGEEEVGAEDGRVLRDVADGDVEVAALLEGGLKQKDEFA